MKCLRPLKHWCRGFEFQSKHGCLCAFILCLCCPVYEKVAALRQDWSPVQEVLPTAYKIHSTGLILMQARRPNTKEQEDITGSEILTAVVMKSSAFWDIHCIFRSVSTYIFLAACFMLASCWLSLQPWRWRRYVPSKRHWLSRNYAVLYIRR
jgi:hypothetical protein